MVDSSHQIRCQIAIYLSYLRQVYLKPEHQKKRYFWRETGQTVSPKNTNVFKIDIKVFDTRVVIDDLLQ